MVYIKRFFLMLQFLTILPVRTRFEASPEDYGKGLVFAPAAGLVIGGILAGVFCLLGFVFPCFIAAVFIIVSYIVLTGGLHLDGLGDTFDGVFSNRPKERILEIMRDSRVGTNAVLAIAAVLMLDAALLAGVGPSSAAKVIALMPVAGRIGSLIGAGSSTYARSGEGLGKSFIDCCGIKEIICGLVIYFAIFFIIAGTAGLVISVIPAICAYILVKLLGRKIGGATGDILGAVCELNQVAFLASAVISQTLGVRL